MNIIPHQPSIWDGPIEQKPPSKKYTLSAQKRAERGEARRQLTRKIYQAKLDAYAANPNLCQQCSQPIQHAPNVRLCATKKKKYCNQSCAAKNNNQFVPKRIKAITTTCCVCGVQFPRYKRHKRCPECTLVFNSRVLNKTKAECRPENITAHARFVMSSDPRDRICAHCGYNKVVQVCHIRAVKDFPKTTLIAEINNPTNLMYLCPNCHWEFDHPSSR